MMMLLVETSNFILDLLCDAAIYPKVKPEIIFGNYFFMWDKKSLGLYSNEIVKFKKFLKDMIPYLETMMKMLDRDYSSISASSKNDTLKKMIFDKGQLSLTYKYNSCITFILNIDSSGSTTFFREERILINDDDIYNKIKNRYNSKDMMLLNKLKEFDNMVYVKWKLGDLLFNRSGHK